MTRMITTPIYYVNDKPHIGHAYTTIAADVLARFHQLNGEEVFFLTGTDEHGQKVDKSAKAKGIDPLAFCDEVSQSFRRLVHDPLTEGGENLLNIGNDDFIRTTEERHKKSAQKFWQKMAKAETPKGNDAIYLANYGGWYAVRDEAYYAENELIEKDGKKLAPTGAEVEWVEEESYFFRLSDYQDDLLEFYKNHPDFILPVSRRNEVMSFVAGGLQDLSISRTTFDWGVPVPGDEKHVMYVWVDALTNYLTAAGFENDPERFDATWGQGDPAKNGRGNAIHIVGKDILRFHAVYWPAFLMAAELPLPKQIVAHGWWTVEGEKMSKSLGNVISPDEMIEMTGGVDQLRYAMLRAMPFGNDGDFSEARMKELINADLANNIGNLAQRCLTMIQKNCEGVVPAMAESIYADQIARTIPNFLYKDGAAGRLGYQDVNSGELISALNDKNVLEFMIAQSQKAQFQEMLRPLLFVASSLNEQFQSAAPWKLFKEEKPQDAQTVLAHVAESLRCLAIYLQPFTPEVAGKLLDLLAVPEDQRTFAHLTEEHALKPGTKLPAPQPLFPRL